MLQAIDRFLTLARKVPGAVAVHGDGTGLGAGGLLVAALLMRDHGFAGGEAMAWLTMVHPGAAVSHSGGTGME